MDIVTVKNFIGTHGINNKLCLINESYYYEGALYLSKNTETKRWEVKQSERGCFLIKEEFETENDACVFFLKKIVSDPTYFLEFNGKNFLDLIEKGKHLNESIDQEN
jgi:hypothetical protein